MKARLSKSLGDDTPAACPKTCAAFIRANIWDRVSKAIVEPGLSVEQMSFLDPPRAAKTEIANSRSETAGRNSRFSARKFELVGAKGYPKTEIGKIRTETARRLRASCAFHEHKDFAVEHAVFGEKLCIGFRIDPNCCVRMARFNRSDGLTLSAMATSDHSCNGAAPPGLGSTVTIFHPGGELNSTTCPDR